MGNHYDPRDDKDYVQPMETVPSREVEMIASVLARIDHGYVPAHRGIYHYEKPHPAAYFRAERIAEALSMPLTTTREA